MLPQETLIITDDGPIRHIRLNRPDKLNAMTSEMQEGIRDALAHAEAEDAVRVIALSGEGRSFCAGVDLKGGPKALAERYRKRSVALDIGMGPIQIQEITTALCHCPKPTAALMQGHVLGAGFDYATSCDFRLATADCRFGDPRVHRSLWAAEGWSYKITRLIPQCWTSRINLRGEPLSGTEAADIGLIHRVYPGSLDLRVAARDYLLELAQIPAASYAYAKKHLLDSLDLTYDASLSHRPVVV